jgi:hypothetical protein
LLHHFTDVRHPGVPHPKKTSPLPAGEGSKGEGFRIRLTGVVHRNNLDDRVVARIREAVTGMFKNFP